MYTHTFTHPCTLTGTYVHIYSYYKNKNYYTGTSCIKNPGYSCVGLGTQSQCAFFYADRGWFWNSLQHDLPIFRLFLVWEPKQLQPSLSVEFGTSIDRSKFVMPLCTEFVLVVCPSTMPSCTVCLQHWNLQKIKFLLLSVSFLCVFISLFVLILECQAAALF